MSGKLSRVARTIIKESKITSDEISTAVAIGDHNFPHLETLIMDPPAAKPLPSMPHLMLSDLLNPLPEVPDTVMNPVCATKPTVSTHSSSKSGSSMSISSLSVFEAMDIEDLPGCSDHGSSMDGQAASSASVVSDKPAPKKNLRSYFAPKGLDGEKNSARKRVRGSEWYGASDSESDGFQRQKDLGKKKKTAAGEGKSKAAAVARAIRASIKSGDLNIDNVDKKKYNKWKLKVIALDSDAVFHNTDIRLVRHSTCGIYVNMQDPYTITPFKKHLEKQCPSNPDVETKRKKQPTVGMPTLFQMAKVGWNVTKSASNPIRKKLLEPALPKCPCPGVTDADTENLSNYLRRTGATGGGSRSVTVIAQERFNRPFRRLEARK